MNKDLYFCIFIIYIIISIIVFNKPYIFNITLTVLKGEISMFPI